MIDWLQALSSDLSWQISLHHPWAAPVVMSLFTVVNSARVLAYVPQVIRAAQCDSGAAGVSTATWAMFFLSHLTTMAYAIVVAGDLIMTAIFAGNALMCAVIVCVTHWRRRAYVRDVIVGGS